MVRGRRGRRLVRAVGRPGRVDEPGARRLGPRDRVGGGASWARGRVPTVVRGRGPPALRLARRSDGLPGRPCRDRAPRPARTGAPASARRARRPDLRGHARRAVRRPPAGGRNAVRRGPGRARDRRPERVGAGAAGLPPIAAPARHVHRDERPRPRAPRGDALDGRRGRVRPADLPPLPAADARRADRVRRLEPPRHRRGRRLGRLRLRRALGRRARARFPSVVPRVPRRAARDLVGRADRRRGPAPAVLRHAAGRGHTLRAGVHGERGRPVSPRGQDPLGPRARGGGRGDDAPDLGRRPHPLPTRAPLLDRGAPRQPGDRPARRPPGCETVSRGADRPLARLPRRLGYMLGP